MAKTPVAKGKSAKKSAVKRPRAAPPNKAPAAKAATSPNAVYLTLASNSEEALLGNLAKQLHRRDTSSTDSGASSSDSDASAEHQAGAAGLPRQRDKPTKPPPKAAKKKSKPKGGRARSMSRTPPKARSRSRTPPKALSRKAPSEPILSDQQLAKAAMKKEREQNRLASALPLGSPRKHSKPAPALANGPALPRDAALASLLGLAGFRPHPRAHPIASPLPDFITGGQLLAKVSERRGRPVAAGA